MKRSCQRIDSQRACDVEYRYDFLAGLQRLRLRAKALWGAGSYAAIEATPVDPSVARFTRRHDMLPLRKEQIAECGDDDVFDKIVDQLGSGEDPHSLGRVK